MSKYMTEIKVGDEVVRVSGGWKTSYRLVKVVRLTKTQLVTENGDRFSRETGDGIGTRARLGMDRGNQRYNEAAGQFERRGSYNRMSQKGPDNLMWGLTEMEKAIEKDAQREAKKEAENELRHQRYNIRDRIAKLISEVGLEDLLEIEEAVKELVES